MTSIKEVSRQLLRPLLLLTVALLALLLSQHLLDPSTPVPDGSAQSAYPSIVHKASLTLFWLYAAWVLGKVLHLLVLNPLFQARAGREAPVIVANLLSLLLLIFTLFTVIGNIWEQSFGALMATSGVITLIAGLALRELITDFFSGIALNIEQPYRLGDWIQVDDDPVGEVVGINWRATHLRLNDKRMIMVPNGQLARSRFINYSFPSPEYRENLALIFSYNIDPKRIENILMAAILATPGLVPGAKHRVRIDAFEPRGILVEVKFWIPGYAQRIPLRHKLAVNIMAFLDQAGIPLPYTTHEVYSSRLRPMDRERRINNEALLCKIDWVESLSSEERGRLAASIRGVEVAAGNEIIREGQAGASLYIVVEGLLRVSHGGDATAQLTPGQTFGERSLLTGERCNATVTAATAGYLLVIGKQDLTPLLHERPELTELLAQTMVSRDRANQNLADRIARQEERRESKQEIGARIRAFFRI